MQSQRLNPRQRQFLKLYTSRDRNLGGNATRCYKAVYGITDDRSAQVAGSRLLKSPVIAELMRQAEERAIKQLNINAEYVLSQSVRLLDRAMGDESVDTIHTSIDDQGQERITVTERRDYDPSTAKAALQLIGQHKDIQAFSQTVEHTHTHRLEQRLAQRSKLIESKAQVIDVPGPRQLPVTDPSVSQVPGSECVGEPGTALIDTPTRQVEDESQKRVHRAEVKENEEAHGERSTFEGRGATAN